MCLPITLRLVDSPAAARIAQPAASTAAPSQGHGTADRVARPGPGAVDNGGHGWRGSTQRSVPPSNGRPASRPRGHGMFRISGLTDRLGWIGCRQRMRSRHSSAAARLSSSSLAQRGMCGRGKPGGPTLRQLVTSTNSKLHGVPNLVQSWSPLRK